MPQDYAAELLQKARIKLAGTSHYPVSIRIAIYCLAAKVVILVNLQHLNMENPVNNSEWDEIAAKLQDIASNESHEWTEEEIESLIDEYRRYMRASQ